VSTPDDISVEVHRGTPSEEELAALLAVVTEAYAREADAVVAADEPTGSAWARSARGLREPLQRDIPWSRSSR